jgi:predicted phosphohydrolase
MEINFDIISDLNLSEEDKFVWEDKVTSLFCIVAGNISSNIRVVQKTLTYLSTLYQGVFYIDGALENSKLREHSDLVDNLEKICKSINNTVYLHNNIAIFNGVAIVGINGWYGNHHEYTLADNFAIESMRRDDLVYLYNTIKKLQIHVDVKNIIVVSNSVPDKKLYFHEMNGFIDDISPTIALRTDSENKVKTWIFGTYNKMVDTNIDGVNYISNPKLQEQNYWAKRITV